MDIGFNSIKYRHDSNGLIELIFILCQSNRVLFFDGGNFEYRDNLLTNKYQDWKNIELEGVISSIRQIEDFDIIIKLTNDLLLKIYFSLNDSYPK